MASRAKNAVLFSMIATFGCNRQADAPAFKMRNMDSSFTLAAAKSANMISSCNENQGVTTCALNGPPLAGANFAETNISFENGRFSALSSSFLPSDLSAVRDNLRSAYGEPCAEEDGEVSSDVGPMPVNHRWYWCFKEGRLLLEQFTYGVTTDRSLIEFPALPRTPAQKDPSSL